jgi:hypothetical protein
MITREPCGVVAAVIPWIYPARVAAWKLGPSLATGNSVVIKPASTTSLGLLRIAELATEAGLPDGVLNVVTGPGDVVGEALGRHPVAWPVWRAAARSRGPWRPDSGDPARGNAQRPRRVARGAPIPGMRPVAARRSCIAGRRGPRRLASQTTLPAGLAREGSVGARQATPASLAS